MPRRTLHRQDEGVDDGRARCLVATVLVAALSGSPLADRTSSSPAVPPPNPPTHRRRWPCRRHQSAGGYLADKTTDLENGRHLVVAKHVSVSSRRAPSTPSSGPTARSRPYSATLHPQRQPSPAHLDGRGRAPTSCSPADLSHCAVNAAGGSGRPGLDPGPTAATTCHSRWPYSANISTSRFSRAWPGQPHRHRRQPSRGPQGPRHQHRHPRHQPPGRRHPAHPAGW